MSYLKKTQNLIAMICDSVGLLRHVTRRKGLRIVNYHWTPEEYRSLLNLHFSFYASCFTTLDLYGLTRFLMGTYRPAKPPIIISFDDGFKNIKSVAAPLLEAHRIPGWFFIIGKAGDADGTIVGGNLNTRYCMDWQDLSELNSKGHVIGSHTLSHTNVGKVTGEALIREIKDSKEMLESKLNTQIKAFAYPFGTKDSFHFEAIKAVTRYYKYAFHSFPDTILSGHLPHALGRTCVESDWNLSMLRMRLSGWYDGRYTASRNRYLTDLRSVENQ